MPAITAPLSIKCDDCDADVSRVVAYDANGVEIPTLHVVYLRAPDTTEWMQFRVAYYDVDSTMDHFMRVHRERAHGIRA
jgi:hypothetical protein